MQEAARSLRYRDLVLVALMTTEPEPFPDNWIYLHDPETRAGRVQNYGAWSAGMVKPGHDLPRSRVLLFRGDEIWEMSDEQAVELATQELAAIGLIDPSKVVDGVKVLVPKAYPMYDVNYESAVATIREYLERFENLKTCGRNGLHRYNNQDHSMWTALLATLNLVDGAQPRRLGRQHRGRLSRGGQDHGRGAGLQRRRRGARRARVVARVQLAALGHRPDP